MNQDDDDSKEATALPFLERDALENPDGDAASLNRADKVRMGKIVAEKVRFGTDEQRREIVSETLKNDPSFNRSYRGGVDPKTLTANGRLGFANGETAEKQAKRFVVVESTKPALGRVRDSLDKDVDLKDLTPAGLLAFAYGADPRLQPKRPRLKRF